MIATIKAQLKGLKDEAKEDAMWRGHKMGRWVNGQAREHKGRAWAWCSRCGAEVTVIIDPKPNESKISGPAVAVNCTR